MKKCTVCGEDAKYEVSNIDGNVLVYSCEQHMDKVFDIVEDMEILETIEQRKKMDNGKTYSLNDVKKYIDERLNRDGVE